MSQSVRVGLTVLFIYSSGFATAHHGLNNYDQTSPVLIAGRVVDFELMDPHSVLKVEVTNEDGTTTIWSVEGGSAHGIAATGLTKEFLSGQPGVSIKAYPHKVIKCSETCSASGFDFDFDTSE